MYSCEFPSFVQHWQLLIGLDRSDTLEHCLICMSFIFNMIPVLKSASTRRAVTVCTFDIPIFLCSADNPGSNIYTKTQHCEFGIRIPTTSAEAS